MKNRILKIITSIALILSLTLSVSEISPLPLFRSSAAVWAAEKKSTVDEILNKMSLREKIAQMMMVSIRDWDENPKDGKEAVNFTVMNEQVAKLIQTYPFGAVIYFAQNLEETRQSYELTVQLQKAAVNSGGIPMLICADQEGGLVYRLKSGTALPGNMALGATADAGYSYLAGQMIGSELDTLGINMNLAPVVDVNNNANNPVIGLRSYSDDPKMVGEMAAASIAGMAEYGVAGCAKHFPGHGDTAVDSHYGLPLVDKSLKELAACELVPFQAVIEQGVDMIMTAHILYPQLEKETLHSFKTGKEEALPATMSDDIITGLLKQTLGFEGIVVTDAMNMEGITDSWEPIQAVINAISAGADMICMPCSLESTEDIVVLENIFAGVEASVQAGHIPMSRIDDAVERILKVKEKHGILEWKESDDSLEKAMATVGSDFHRELERQIAAAAVTVVQNKNHTLPLKINENSKVLIMVPYENEKAQMLIGWNRARKAGLIPDGAEVRSVRFDKKTTSKTYQKNLQWADTVILLSQVSSSAKMNGESWESAYLLEVIEYAKEEGKTTIVQSIDKPYDVQSYPDADAVLAVYGSKGSSVDPTEALIGGVTETENACGPNITAGMEVILGTFGARGTLPVDIPKLVNGKYTSEIVFERGFGLSYEKQ